MKKEIEKWFREMQYMGEIPENFMNICNRSSSFIWDQLIANTKPRQEIEKIKKNIILNRLRIKPLNKQDEFSYSMVEIQKYKEKVALQNKLKNLEKLVYEKQVKENKLSNSNKIKYIMIERLKFKIKINEEREFLLRKKCILLEKNIEDFQELLISIRNLTPVELDENPNHTAIKETLQICANKLQDHLSKMPVPADNHILNHSSNQLSYTSKKPRRNHDTFAKCLTMTERRSSMAISTSKKRFFQTQTTNSLRKIKKCLFSEEMEDMEDISQPFQENTNKRDSLGILSGCFLNEDDFTVLDIQNVEKDTVLISNSNSFNLLKNILNELSEDETVNNLLTNLLHQHNRQIIWNNIQSSVENIHSNIVQTFLKDNKSLEPKKNIQHDIAQLQMYHVQLEFQIMKQRRILAKYIKQISQQKDDIYDYLSRNEFLKGNFNEVSEFFERQLENIGLNATLSGMKNEIDSARNIEENSNLLIVSGKLGNVKKEILRKINSIKHNISVIEKNFSSIEHTRNRTLTNIRKFGPFISNTTWFRDLNQKWSSTETKTFEKLPFDFNGRFMKQIGNIYIDYFGTDMELDQSHLAMLTNILESPFSPPETILLNILKCKMKLNVLKSTQDCVQIPNYKKYSLEKLQKQESYIQFAIDRLNSLICSTSSRKSLSTEEMAKELMQLWLEVPYKEFIPDKRMVEGKCYKFYENQYDSSYNYL